jgi:DnaJ-class molecular chaperone
MTTPPAHSPPATHQGKPCPHCGGSGTLRLADQRYRTCLECLGRGQLQAIGETLPMGVIRSASPVSSAAAR